MAKEAAANGFCREHSGVVSRVQGLEKTVAHNETETWAAIEKLRDAVNTIRNRPPAWVTAVISLLTFLLGISVTVATFAIRAAMMK